ncbi:energy transducer TonB [Flavobacterium sp. W21_SRS_FM6]|uniref:energy transducer TonB n=1 Tax=Flavobacterium sp. W21_SRS_FM6 TaxID=3240268 RepID=UPI003F8FB9E4
MNTNLVLPQTAISIPKRVGSVVIASTITFGLFVMMQKLINNNDMPIVEPSPPPVLTFLQTIEDIPINERPTLKKMPKTNPIPKPETRILEETPDNKGLVAKFVPDINIGRIGLGISTQMSTGEGDARPIVRMEPKYPPEAAREGIEGWVKLLFSIDTLGQVANIQVVESEPNRVFDRAAKQALSKWKYKPQIVAGAPQAQDGMMVVLDFKLAK